MVAPLQLDDVEMISSHVVGVETPQAVIAEVTRPQQPEIISSQQPVEKGSQEETETWNVLLMTGQV